MKLLSIWHQLGSYIVPALALWAMIVLIQFFWKWNKYIIFLNEVSYHPNFFESFKRYVLAEQKATFYFRKRRYYLWRIIFLPKYMRLADECLRNAQFELEKIKHFYFDKRNDEADNQRSFLAQYWRIFHYFFDDDTVVKIKADYSLVWSIIHPMLTVIKAKMIELYGKHVLYVLKTEGYFSFSDFLHWQYAGSKSHPENSPYRIFYHESLTERIVKENGKQVLEYLTSEFNRCTKINNIHSKVRELETLESSFVFQHLSFLGSTKSKNCFEGQAVRKKILDELDDTYCLLVKSVIKDKDKWIPKIKNEKRKNALLKTIS